MSAQHPRQPVPPYPIVGLLVVASGLVGYTFGVASGDAPNPIDVDTPGVSEGQPAFAASGGSALRFSQGTGVERSSAAERGRRNDHPSDAGSEGNAEPESTQAREVGQRALGSVLRHLEESLARLRSVRPDASAEEIASEFHGDLRGISSVIREVVPAEIAAPMIARELCRDGVSDDTRLALSWLVVRTPAFGSVGGLDCVLDRTEEDAVLAAALDAWQAGGLGDSPAWRRWRDNATDPGIRRRFDDSSRNAIGVRRSRAVEGP